MEIKDKPPYNSEFRTIEGSGTIHIAWNTVHRKVRVAVNDVTVIFLPVINETVDKQFAQKHLPQWILNHLQKSDFY